MRIKLISRLILIGVGIALVIFALLAPSQSLYGYESGSVGQFLILFLGLLLMVIGAQNPEKVGPRISRVYQVIAVMLLNTVVMLLVIEVLAIIAWNALAANIPENRQVRHALDMPYYKSVSWGQKFWEEYPLVNPEVYTPFVLWRRAPFEGETINVDENGIRLTPGGECTEDAYRVFVFGGSTLWGLGAPDSMTIPAYLQQKLAEQRDAPICVINYGELGYVSTQEVIRFTAELQKQNVPDLVIFYDGLNDVYATYQSGMVGTHQNLTAIQARFLSNRTHFIVQWIRSSYTMQMISLWLTAQNPAVHTDASLDSALAGKLVTAYNVNRQIIAGLAQTYDFDYLFLWQPMITNTNKVMTEEEKLIAGGVDPVLWNFYSDVHKQILTIEEAHFYDMADTFDDYPEQVWFDSAHMTPPGNDRVAARIADLMTSQE